MVYGLNPDRSTVISFLYKKEVYAMKQKKILAFGKDSGWFARAANLRGNTMRCSKLEKKLERVQGKDE